MVHTKMLDAYPQDLGGTDKERWLSASRFASSARKSAQRVPMHVSRKTWSLTSPSASAPIWTAPISVWRLGRRCRGTLATTST